MSPPGMADEKVWKKCPECGGRLLEILWGLPMYEAFEAAQRGEIALGGWPLRPAVYRPE